MKTVTAVVGDFYHDADLAKQSLMEAIAPLIEEKKIKLSYALTTELADALGTKPDMVILFAEDRIDPVKDSTLKWMTEEVSDQIVDYVKNGGAWFAWHSGLASYATESSYVKMLRGYFLSHPVEHQRVRYVVSEASTISQGVAPFSFLDEHYFVHVEEENTNVFMRSSSVDGESIAGWHHPFGKGLVCCLTPAHRSEGLLDAGFVHILRDALMWTASL